MTVQTNDKTDIKMNTQRANTNDTKGTIPKTHAIKFIGSNMVREWLKKLKTKKKLKK